MRYIIQSTKYSPTKSAGTLIAAFAICLAPMVADGRAAVTLTSPAGSSQSVGTPVVWTAAASGVTAPLYRFRVAPFGGAVRVVQDFSPNHSFIWTAFDEGAYRIAVDLYDIPSGVTDLAWADFEFTSRVTNGKPLVSATANPLVAIYSAPPCASGTLQVTFQSSANTSLTQTDIKPCRPGKSVNFIIAGMYAASAYSLQQTLTVGGSAIMGPVLSFQTGTPSVPLPKVQLAAAPTSSVSFTEKLIAAGDYATTHPELPPLATDLLGTLVWYYPVNQTQPAAILTRPTRDHTMMLLLSAVNPENGFTIVGQVMREVDLAGNLVRETNVGAINLQLKTRGDDPIDWLAHEALRLPNGHTLTFGTTERLLTNVQQPGTVDVVGDMIIDLDENLKVAWTWNPFNFLDTKRKAVMNEQCVIFCGPLRLGNSFNDWTHSNSILHMADGSLMVSMRNQDWVIKIDYGNGSGTGKVLWRLGNQGDFTAISNDPWPWFSHQHDFEFDGTNFLLFDNGNTRVTAKAGKTSRGQAWAIDETARTARLVLNADMGVFSGAVGSAQRLSNGNYQFMNGYLHTPNGPAGLAVQVKPDGTQCFSLTYASYVYRSFSLKDLYSY